MGSDDDVPTGIDLRDPQVAATWTAEADVKRPWRREVRRQIAALVGAARASDVLELGSGPGFLAEEILSACAIERYTLLDFSPPFLAMCRQRLAAHLDKLAFVEADFTRADWPDALGARRFDAVVSMQAVHELRHKRHMPALYTRAHDLLKPSGVLVVSDHTPPDATPRSTSLHATAEEQHAAMISAGFATVRTHVVVEGLYVVCASHA